MSSRRICSSWSGTTSATSPSAALRRTPPGRADIAAIARGAGIEHAYTVKTLDDFDRHCEDGLRARTPYVLVAKIDRSVRRDIKRKHSDGREDKYIFVRHVESDREHRHHGAKRAQLETGSFIMRMLAVILALLVPSAADAAEINALISTALRAATDELLPPFERAHGHTIRASYGPSGALIPRFNAGQPADIFLTDSAAIDELIKEGKVVPGRTDLARTGIGIAVRRGAPKPDVSSPEALKQALLAARSVGHAAPAGGSITAPHIMRMFEQLGIAAEMAPKVRLAAGGPNGRVSVLISSGEADIGLQQVSELMSNPDVEVIGMLPAELQQITTYSAGITTSAKEPDVARMLIHFLAAPEAIAIYKLRGLML